MTYLRVWLPAVVVYTALFAAPGAGQQQGQAQLERAFARLYSFDFNGTHAVLNQYIAANPNDPLGYAVRAAAYLFFELDRLSILETEFVVDDNRILDKKKLKPDPATKTQLMKAVEDGQSRASNILKTQPNDRNALFSMCISQGVVTDYTALIEKKQMGSLSSVKRSNAYAQRLLKLDPNFYDAYLTTGITEYLMGSLPFFIRWFVRVEDVKGSKEVGIRNLQQVARSGHYFKPFAKILLAIAFLREKKPQESQKLLAELHREYPENPLIHKELLKVTARLHGM